MGILSPVVGRLVALMTLLETRTTALALVVAKLGFLNFILTARLPSIKKAWERRLEMETVGLPSL